MAKRWYYKDANGNKVPVPQYKIDADDYYTKAMSDSRYYDKSATDTMLATKVDKTDITQSTGTSTTAVMSQNAVSDIVDELESEVIYDVTANNDGVTFDSLSALLSDENLSTLIPTSVRHGGMTIRFVQSSDNKYVQYRLMANTFSTKEVDWQGIDDEPTSGSENIVKSGGVSSSINNLEQGMGEKLTKLESKIGEVYDGVTNVISISKNEEDVVHLIDVSNVTTEGYVDPDNGSIKSASGMYYTSIDVKKGDVVKIKNTVDSVVEYYYTRFIAAFDSNGDVIPSAGASTATYEYVVPEGIIKLMPTFYKITPKVEIEITRRKEVIKSSVNNNTIPYEAFTEDAKEMLKTPFIKVQKDVNISTIETIPVTAMSNGFMAPNGVPSPDAQGYKYTSKIGVNTGDIISFQNGLVGGHQDVTPRFICAYDANENPIESRGSYGNIATMVITEDVHYIVVTTYTNENFTGLNILKSSAENKEDKHIKLLTNYGYQYKGSLSSGQICTFPLNTLKDKKSLAISVVLSSYFNGTLRIGRLHANSAFPYIDIDGTNVTVVNEFRTLSKPHGLSIANDLQVYLKIKNEYKIEKLVLVSGGISVDMADEDWRWFGNFGQPFVRPIGIEIPYISVGWSASAFNQDIWICGDSYTSNASDRWVGYIYEHNLDNKIAVMGYSGSKSPEQYVSLCNMLKIHKPKFVVWCLGMNEEDTNAVNPQWKIYLDAVKNLCELYGINLILATIPCVPSIDNTYKNAIVRNSGYRYIDFAKAVNAENAGATWYIGMLSSDNVHPSEMGAKALFYQAISDVPEMLSL